MQSLFGVPIATIMWILVFLTGIVFIILLVLANRNFLLFRMGLRNLERRRSQTLLIVLGLTLSTVLITSAFSVGDTVTYSFRLQVAGDLGPVDETITSTIAGRRFGRDASLNAGPYFSLSDYNELVTPFARDSRLVAISPLIITQGIFKDLANGQSKQGVSIRAYPERGNSIFTQLPLPDGGFENIGQLRPGEIFLNQQLAADLQARTGDKLEVTLNQRPVYFVVRQIVSRDGLAGHSSTALLPLEQVQGLLGRSGQINVIAIANQSGGPGRVSYSKEIATALRATIIQTSVARDIRAILSLPELQVELQRVMAQAVPQQQTKLKQLQEELGVSATTPISERLKNLLDDPDISSPLQSIAANLPSKSLGVRLNTLLGNLGKFTVREIKSNELDAAELQGNQFTSIFLLCGIFSIGIGLLLIFLIFVMLAAERRGEMGISRAVGLRRTHLVETFLFEGSTYDLAASLIGVIGGLTIGLILVAVVRNLFGQLGFQIEAHFEPTSVVISFCLGVLLTFATVGFSAWRVSLLNIVSAIRNLPEPNKIEVPLWQLLVRPFSNARLAFKFLFTWHPLKALSYTLQIFTALFRFGMSLSMRLLRRGLLMIGFGLIMVPASLASQTASTFNLGVSLILIGLGLFIRWFLGFVLRKQSDPVFDRVGFSFAGASLLIFWALPISFVAGALHIPPFQFGNEFFILAGFMLVAGAIWTMIYNGETVLAFSFRFLGNLGRLAPIIKMAVAYPLQQKFRTGMALAMFALVMFTIILLTVIYAAQDQYFGDINGFTGGYTIVGGSTSPIDHIKAAVVSSPHLHVSDFSAIASTGQAVLSVRQLLRPGEVLPAPQPGAPRAATNNGVSWTSYPVVAADQDYLTHVTYHFGTRAVGYISDQAIWEALRTHPDYAVINNSGVPSRDGSSAAGPPSQYSFTLRGVFRDDKTMDPVKIQMLNPQTNQTATLTIIGVLDNRAFIVGGLLLSSSNSLLGSVPLNSYYFQIRPGSSPQAESDALNEAFVGQGFTSVLLADRIETVKSIGQGFGYLLEGFTGLGLLVGIVALGVISSRAVVERRQQIGMLRAIGYSKEMIWASFLLESSFVSLLGALVGVLLGTLVGYNFVSYLTFPFVFPSLQIFLLVLASYIASLFTTWIPAYNASKVFPAEALRYE